MGKRSCWQTLMINSGGWLSLGVGTLFCIQVQAAQVQPLSELVLYPWQSAPAIAVSPNESTLAARIAAQVKAIPAQVSQTVKQGDLLVQLDCADHELALAGAKAQVSAASAQLQLARSEYQRTLQLRRNDLVAQSQQDSGEADVKVREAALQQSQVARDQAALQVNRCQVLAPFDGVVTQRNAGLGQWAVVGTPLVTVVETGGLELSAGVVPEEVPQLLASTELLFDAGDQLPVTVARAGAVVDARTRNIEVRLTFPESKPLAGTAGKLLWRDPRPFIPARLIVRQDGRLGIFVDQGGKAHFMPLADALPGRDCPTTLALDLRVVSDNPARLREGDDLNAQTSQHAQTP